MRAALTKLLEIRDELGSGGGVDEAIANPTGKIEDLDPAFKAAADEAQRLKNCSTPRRARRSRCFAPTWIARRRL